jgi:mannan endo-1,4-beta-mannosidase
MKKAASYLLRISTVSILLLMSCSKKTVQISPDTDNSIFLRCSIYGDQHQKPNAQRFGFFSSKLWQDYETNLREEINVFGAVPGYVLWYLQMGEGFPIQVAESNKQLGIYTVINQDLRSDQFSPTRNEAILKEIIAGKWDDYFRKFARQARELDMKVYYRFGYEMNGNWFPWGKKSKLFVNAWKHTSRLFEKEKADNVLWIFSPSVVWGQQTFEKDILPYYPGNDYVDVVALDGYNFGDRYDRHHQWESFHKVFANSVAGIMTFGKPMWIAEIGCPTDPRRHYWLRDFLEFFDSNSCFEVFLWFNEYKQGEPNFRIDADDESLRIFRQWAEKTNLDDQNDNIMAMVPYRLPVH